MISINGKKFYSFPNCCYECPFLLEWGTNYQKGTCTLFNLTKSKYANLSTRCKKMFDKAKTFPDGTELVLVAK